MELGKDILAIAPDGVPCAYQLKNIRGGKLNLSKWRATLEPQLISLIHNAIVHPSIDSARRHRSFIVINGELEEEVARSIDDINAGLRGRPKLKTIVKGDLLARFQQLGTDFWPPEASASFLVFLEMFLQEGIGPLPKAKLTSLLESTIPHPEGRTRSKAEFARAISAGAVVCSSAIGKFTNTGNHWAQFEAWTIYFAHTLRIAEQHRLPSSTWKPAAELASIAMFNALGNLCEEMVGARTLGVGDPAVDRAVFRVRLTLLLGLMGLYGVWRKARNETHGEHDQFIERFMQERIKSLLLWGEAAVPQWIATYFHFRSIDATRKSESLLEMLVRAICLLNAPEGHRPLTSPYFEAEETLQHSMGVEGKVIKDAFEGGSHSLQGIVHLLVRCNFKQLMKDLWPGITRIDTMEFVPTYRWGYYQWRCQQGEELRVQSQLTQSWRELRSLAADSRGETLPRLIKQFPMEFLAFLIVFPHRFSADGIRWLDTEIITIQK